MNIHSKKGDEVKFTQPTAGYLPHQKIAAKYLEVQKVYTIERIGGYMNYIDEKVEELHEEFGLFRKITAITDSPAFEAFLRLKIQETIEKCAKVAEDFAKDSFDEHEASACRVIASTIRKIGD